MFCITPFLVIGRGHLLFLYDLGSPPEALTR